MITVNAAFAQTAKALGLIGRRDENGTRQIAFDCSDILAEYPEAEIICVFRRACDRDAYIAKSSMSDKTLICAITDADVAVPGVLQIELRAIIGQDVRKSATYTAQVDDSLRGFSEKPGSPAADMLNRLDATLERAEESVSAADQAAKQASDAAAAAQDVAETVKDKLDKGELKGDKGDPGKDAAVTAVSVEAALGYRPAAINDLSCMEPWYEGIDLTEKFADEIAGYASPWAWIKARIASEDFAGLHTADYIPFTTTNGHIFHAQIMGINTYKGSGVAPDGDASLSKACGKHIDFITRELWPERVQYNLADCNNSPDAKTGVIWTTTNAYHFLNSLAGQVINSAKPYTMANVDYTSGGVYYYLPDELKNAISEKKVYAEVRYDDALLTHSNGVNWASLGKLWLPNEVEILGVYVYGAPETTTYCAVYPLFNGFRGRVRLKHDAPRRSSWWQMSAYEGSTTDVLVTTHAGGVTWINASYALSVPICFRIA